MLRLSTWSGRRDSNPRQPAWEVSPSVHCGTFLDFLVATPILASSSTNE
jgi:hypothetical protein